MIAVKVPVCISALAALATTVFFTPAVSSVGVDDEEVVFRLETYGRARVFLVGDFNGWNPTLDRLAEHEGGFEIRLFLLPGMYRYRFVVDGESMPDPDNPHRDGSGNSFFILVERDGRYEIVFSDEPDRKRLGGTFPMSLRGAVDAAAGEQGTLLFLAGEAYGSAGEDGSGAVAVGFKYDAPKDGTYSGAASIIRGEAAYRFGEGTVTAFCRSADLGIGDPLTLIGTVGPYRYPLGLFCRGISYDGTVPFGVDAALAYASRIDGYSSTLESGYDDGSGLFSDRNRTDSDIVALRIRKQIGRLTLGYLYRTDRRPKNGAWSLGPGRSDMYRGHETAAFAGVHVSLAGREGLHFDVRYLAGNSRLRSSDRSVIGSGEWTRAESEYEWEEGYSFQAGFSYNGERRGLEVTCSQTALQGLRQLREGRDDGVQAAVGSLIRFETGGMDCRVTAKVESYSSSNTGSVFWIQRRNFWLDGDVLTAGHVPFLDSRGIYEIAAVVRGTVQDESAYPYGDRFLVSILQRGDTANRRRLVRELLLRKCTALAWRLSFIADLRYSHYDHEAWNGKRDFLGTFVGLVGRVTGDCWVSISAGVNPYSFDEWLYAHSRFGREKRILQEGLFGLIGNATEAELVGALREAERSLGDEWSISFEAGVRF